MFFEDDSRENVSCGRLCIRTSHKSIISEVINVIVVGVSYKVRIREVGIWSIDIQKQKEESDSNLSMNESDEVDMHDDLDILEEENATKMSNTKLNEGDASTNDSELGSCPPGCATSFGNMYVNENKKVKPHKEETSKNCKETIQDIDDVSIKDNMCQEYNGTQNNVRPEEENATKMSNTKLNEGDASTNDSELGSCPPRCATSFGSKRRIKSVSSSSD
ncbi:hypothetical protein Tco_1069978, partial [Tanacetum coccineum]